MAKAPVKYTLCHKPAARRDLKKLKKNKIVLESIVKTIKKLSDDPRPQGAKPLKGDTKYRVRDGEFRILYEVDDDARTVTIACVEDRKDVYGH